MAANETSDQQTVNRPVTYGVTSEKLRFAWQVWWDRLPLLAKAFLGLVLLPLGCLLLWASMTERDNFRSSWNEVRGLHGDRAVRIQFLQTQQQVLELKGSNATVLYVDLVDGEGLFDPTPLNSLPELETVYLGRLATPADRERLQEWRRILSDKTVSFAMMNLSFGTRVAFFATCFWVPFLLIIGQLHLCCDRSENRLLPASGESHVWIAVGLLTAIWVVSAVVLFPLTAVDLRSIVSVLSFVPTALSVMLLGDRLFRSGKISGQVGVILSYVLALVVILAVAFLPELSFQSLHYYASGGQFAVACILLVGSLLICAWQLAFIANRVGLGPAKDAGAAAADQLAANSDRQRSGWFRALQLARQNSTGENRRTVSAVPRWWLGNVESVGSIFPGLLVPALFLLPSTWRESPSDLHSTNFYLVLFVMMAFWGVGTSLDRRGKILSQELLYPTTRKKLVDTIMASVFTGLVVLFFIAMTCGQVIDWAMGVPASGQWIALAGCSLLLLSLLGASLMPLVLMTRRFSIGLMALPMFIFGGAITLGILTRGMTMAGPQPYFSQPAKWVPILIVESMVAAVTFVWSRRLLNEVEVGLLEGT